MKILGIAAFPLLVLALAASPVFAQPEKTNGFVCPVLGGQAGQHGNSQVFVVPPGGFYTVIGPDVYVPVHATNIDGAGSPAGPFASPGDENYSPIWATE